MNRRNFAIFTVAGIALGFGIGKILPKSRADELYLRPPGAVKEFESLCIKCGQCVQVCPYYAIDLLDIDATTSLGTPCISPELRGCYLCDLFPCVLACPSGALSHDTTQISDVKMGVAVLAQANLCLAFSLKNVDEVGVSGCLERKTHNEREEVVKQSIKEAIGKPCDLCIKLCPIGDEAINMGKASGGENLPVIGQKCVGCGVCAEVCPSKIIKIFPNKNYDEIYKGV